MAPDSEHYTIEELLEKLDGEDGLAARIAKTVERLDDIPADADHAGERADIVATLARLRREEHDTAKLLGTRLAEEIQSVDGSLMEDLGNSLTTLSLEDANENELSAEDRLSDCAKVSLRNEGFLDDVHKLDEIVSYKHILEEMDCRTYLQRVTGQLARLKRTGTQLQRSIRNDIERIEELRARWEEKRKQLGIAHEACKKRGVSIDQAERLAEPVPEFDTILDILQAYEKRLDAPLVRFTGARNEAYIRSVTTYAAKVAEQGLLPSILALANALVAVLLLQYVITNSGSLPLLENQTALIVTAAVLAYVGALWAGKRNRKRRIERLNGRMMTALRSVFEIGATDPGLAKANWFVRRARDVTRYVSGARDLIDYLVGLGFMDPAGRSDTKELFAFPKIDLGQYRDVPQMQQAGPASQERGTSPQIFAEPRGRVLEKDVANRWRVAALCAVIAAVPALLFLPLLLAEDRVTQLVGRTIDGERCELATGPIVRATSANLHIATDRDVGRLERLFPSYPAQTIDRRAVFEIRHDPTDLRELQKCDEVATLIREAAAEPRSSNWSFLEGFGRTIHVTNHQGDPLLDATTRAQIDAIHASVTAPQQPSVVHVVNPSFTVNAPEGKTVNHVLSLYVDGQHIDGGPRKNSMLFPLFREPVRGFSSLSREGAYEYGRKSLLPESKDGSRNRAMLETAFRPLLECLEPGSSLELDVMAFASEVWRSPGDFKRSELNHELAEGRRAAVLDFLRKLLVKSKRQGEILLTDASGGGAWPLRSLNDTAKPARRFSDPDRMREVLLNWVADDGSEVVKGEIRELLERSAVVRLIAIDGSTCLAGSAVDGDIVAAAKSVIPATR